MPGSVYSSLLSTFDSRSISDIASRFGASERAVSQGLEMSSATLLAGLANKAGDSTSMNQLFQFVSEAPSNVNVSDVAGAALDPSHASPAMGPLLDSGKNFLARVFGSNQSSIFDAVARSTGLQSNAISSLMSMAAPLMMTSLGRLVREDRMNPAGLGRVLTHEAQNVSDLLPPGVSTLLSATPATPPPASEAAATGRPLAISVVREEAATTRPLSITAIPERPGRSRAWWWLLLLIPLFFYLGYRARHPTMTVFHHVVAPNAPGRALVIRDPAAGRLLASIQNPAIAADRGTQFDFDHLLFATGSSTLLPGARGQLADMAAILKAYPNVRLLIAGHTDSTGNAAQNLRLSQARANAVKAGLVALGISPDRLETQGIGQGSPAANNSTAGGRAMNRRVSVAVTQK